MEGRVRALDGFCSRSAHLRNWKARRAAARVPGPSQALAVGPLISPLRFDILTRVEYFRFFEANMGLAASRWADYVDLAMGHPYYAWFRSVAMARRRFARLAAGHEEVGERWVRYRFEQRLRTSNALFVNFAEHGFDRRRTLVFRRPSVILPTATGKVVQRDVFVTDGCHRLALLVYAGAVQISPAYYRVIPHKSPFRPIDNTSIMLQRTHVSMEEYVRFLALGYGVHPAGGLSSLWEEVRAHDGAQRVAEMDRVLSHDLELLARAVA